MSQVTTATFLIAIILIVISVAAQLPLAAGGAGVILMVGLIYAFVVTKREEDRGTASAD